MKRNHPNTLHYPPGPHHFLSAFLGSLLLSSALCGPAFAATAAGGDSKGEPVMLSAQQVNYDHEASVVSAEGKVEISQGDTIMIADYVTYDQVNNIVRAKGNISVLEEGGNVVFAEEVELKDDLKAGVIRQFKARLSDNSLFVAAKGQKHNEDVTELDKAVYSPCKVCAAEGDAGKAPMWQIRADHVLINQKTQEVAYDDAWMEVYGIPVLYTPYFAHPTPDADNKSGILTPEFKQSTNLGTVFKLPVYYAIAPDKDLTITPIITSLEGPVAAGQYRQMFDTGSIEFDGSITKPQNRDAGGAVDKGQSLRGHFNGAGKFQPNDIYDWGFDVHRVSDDTYLRRYGFGNDTLLTSRIYGQGINFLGDGARSYGQVQALKFEGLTAQDNAQTAPLVLPMADFAWQSSPGIYDSRLSVSGNIMSYTRDAGSQSRRFSNSVGWKIPYISSDGQVVELETSLRSDIYSVDGVQQPNGLNFEGEVGRVMPQASLTWRYPLINHFEQGSLLLEPVVMAAISPNGSNSSKIPNIDSQVPEFNTSNLFSANRFAGYDQIETGPQASYGLRGQAQIQNHSYIDWLMGQHYYRNNEASFPYSTDTSDHLSDYVGKFGIAYDPFTIAYRWRLDKETLDPKRNEVDASLVYAPVSISGSYLQLKNDPTLLDKEEISGVMSVDVTKQWQWSIGARRDMELNQLTGASTGLLYKNECVDILNTVSKEYTRDRDIKPSTTYLFRIFLKNLD